MRPVCSTWGTVRFLTCPVTDCKAKPSIKKAVAFHIPLRVGVFTFCPPVATGIVGLICGCV